MRSGTRQLSGAPLVPFRRDVEKRLGEMQKQIDELRHSVEALQDKAKEKSARSPSSA